MKKKNGIYQLYQNSLKGNKVEEVFDKYLFRPFGFIIAFVCYKCKIPSNTVTIFSGILALFSFIALYFEHLYFGGSLFLISYLFDLADGQVARLSHKSSEFGRILDGYMDLFSYLCLGFGISFYMLRTSHTFLGFILMTLLGLSQALHAILFDGIRNEYICISKDQKNCRKQMLSIDEINTNLKKMTRWYNELQQYLFKNIRHLENMSSKERDDFIFFTSFLGSGTKYFFILLGLFLNKLTFFLLFLLITTNIIYIITILRGKKQWK